MFLDTSGLFSLASVGEPFHQMANQILLTGHRFLTHSFILCELVALGTSRKVPRQKVLDFLETTRLNPDLEIIWVNDALHARAIQLLQARLDKNYSLADAISFVLMRDRQIQEALATDHHFEQEGFIRLLK